MSRGPGKIEQAIEALLTEHPDNAYTVADLCRHIYGDVEKRRRVSVLRAMKKVRERNPGYDLWKSAMRGNTWAIFDHTNVHGYGMAKMKCDRFESYDGIGYGCGWRNWDGSYKPVNGAYRTEDELREKLQDESFQQHVRQGGTWWLFCELRKAEIENDLDRLEELRPLREEHERQFKAWRTQLTSIMKR